MVLGTLIKFFEKVDELRIAQLLDQTGLTCTFFKVFHVEVMCPFRNLFLFIVIIIKTTLNLLWVYLHGVIYTDNLPMRHKDQARVHLEVLKDLYMSLYELFIYL